MVNSSATLLAPSLTVITNLPSPSSLQVAAAAYSLSNGTGLVEGGCLQQDNTTDCGIACTNLTQVFSDARTFQNCLAFPTITEILSTVAISEDYEKNASHYGITAAKDNTTASSVKNNILNCLAGYYNATFTDIAFTSPYNPCSNLSDVTTFPITLMNDELEYYDDYNVYNHQYEVYADASTVRSDVARNYSVYPNNGTLGCIQTICDGAKRTATVDTDISGIGIFASYFMQAGIVILAWLLLMFWDFGLYQLTFCIKVWTHGPEGAIKIAKRTQARFHEHRERVTEGLIEFHKAQCFFMFAIQVAALAAKHGNFLQHSSLQQIYNNDAFIDVLSTGGFLPITFVLYVLRTVGHRSIYMFILTFCTVVVSAIALLSGEKFPKPDFGGTAYPSCDGVNPVGLCLDMVVPIWDIDAYVFNGIDWDDDPNFSIGIVDLTLTNSSLAYSLTVLTLLLLELCSFHRLPLFKGIRAWTSRDDWPKMKRPSWIDSSTKGFLRLANSSNLNPFDVSRKYSIKDVPALRSVQSRYELQIAPHVRSTSQSSLNLVKLVWHAGFDSPRKVSHRLMELLNTIVFALFLYYMSTYVSALTTFGNAKSNLERGFISDGIPINLSSWTFGQLVAVTVWLPPLLQYAYLEINGMQGQRWHLPKGYRVVASKPESEPMDPLSSSFETQSLPTMHRRSRTQTGLMEEHDEDSVPITEEPEDSSQRLHRMGTFPRRKTVPTKGAEEDSH